MITLEVVKGPEQGRTFTFDGHDSFIVGRAACAHFRLPPGDHSASRVHFMIETNPPLCQVTDLDSRNGTGVNGVRVQKADLRHGDLIQAGTTVLRVRLTMSVDAISPTQPPRVQGGNSARPDDAPQLCDTAERDSPPIAPTAQPVSSSSANEDALPRIEGYRVHRPLGRGGMGVVYLGERLRDGVAVAIKTIQPAISGSEYQVECFLREVRILSELQHPGIVRFEEAGRAGELLYFVMEYVPGADASREVKKYDRVAIASVVRVICQALEALQYAHDAGFVHRDVKPSNLLLTKTPSGTICKLADFGLARAYNISPLSGLTLTGDVGGTLPYMPPEQITDYRHTCPATDQYATAATLYQLLTGRYLFDFDHASSAQRISAILCEPHTSITARRSDVPAALEQTIDRALDKDPEKRFPSAAAFREALAPFAARR